jgi:hypothetical protein
MHAVPAPGQRCGVGTRAAADIQQPRRRPGLRPLQWDTLIEATGGTAPSLTDVVARAPDLAQATLVLLSPDDIVELDADLALDGYVRES